MKKIIVLCTILTGLVGCSSSSTPAPAPTTTTTPTLTNAILNGTWVSECTTGEDLGTYEVYVVTYNNGSGQAVQTIFDDASCAIDSTVTVNLGNFTYILGSDVTVNGTVAGITKATQIDATETSPNAGNKRYDIFAVANSKLYDGDDNGANDGLTAATRPAQLDSNGVFTKQ